MYNEMEYQEEYRMADLIRRQWLGIITAEEQAELEAWSLQEEHARLYAKIRNQAEWKSHATLTLLAKQDCPLWLQYD